jgi:hypothetical protein
MNPHKWHKRLTGLAAFVEVLITGSVAGIAERGTNYGSSTVKRCPQRAFYKVREARSGRRYNANDIRGASRILEYHFFDKPPVKSLYSINKLRITNIYM